MGVEGGSYSDIYKNKIQNIVQLTIYIYLIYLFSVPIPSAPLVQISDTALSAAI